MSLGMKNLLLKKELLSLVMIVLLCAIFGVVNPAFFTVVNLYDLMKVCSYPAIFACGVMIVLINGGIDFSFMWVGMFAAYSTSKLYSILQVQHGFVAPLAAIYLTCIAIGAALGSFNALLVSKFKVPVFIATLSSANIFMGIMFQFIGSEYIFPEQMPRRMIGFSNALILKTVTAGGGSIGLHVSVIVAIVVMVLVHLIMKYTLMGRSVYALGGDIASTERVGFNLNHVRLFIYMLAGSIAGLAGGIGVSNIQVANPYDFQGREMTVIAAVVIGGTRISGGKGSVIGVALGVLLTNILSQNLVLIGVPPEYNKFVFGLLIIFAATVQAIQEKMEARAAR
jgi:simple sugar transport system permease protein